MPGAPFESDKEALIFAGALASAALLSIGILSPNYTVQRDKQSPQIELPRRTGDLSSTYAFKSEGSSTYDHIEYAFPSRWGPLRSVRTITPEESRLVGKLLDSSQGLQSNKQFSNENSSIIPPTLSN